MEQTRNNTALRLCCLTLALPLLLLCLDLPLYLYCQRTGLFVDSVDLHSESVLYTKALSLKEAGGTRIAMFGDSAVVGIVMKENGDANWRRHTLSAELQRQLASPALVYNFGVNAARPADLERVIRAVLPSHPELVLIEINLAGFVRREGKKKLFGRPWIGGVKISPEGALEHEADAGLTLPARLDQAADAFLQKHWLAYRYRDFFQWRFLDGPPKELLERAAQDAQKYLPPAPEPPVDENGALASNLAKARELSKTVDLEETNAQVIALRSILRLLKESNQPAILFYVPENPAYLGQLFSPERYARLKDELNKIAADYASPRLQFLLQAQGLAPAEYLDHIHFSGAGNRKFVQGYLLPAVNALPY